MLDTTRYAGLIPVSTLETLVAFAETARPMGHFATAVLSNDLFEAFGRADEHNTAAMHANVEAWRGLYPVED